MSENSFFDPKLNFRVKILAKCLYLKPRMGSWSEEIEGTNSRFLATLVKFFLKISLIKKGFLNLFRQRLGRKDDFSIYWDFLQIWRVFRRILARMSIKLLSGNGLYRTNRYISFNNKTIEKISHLKKFHIENRWIYWKLRKFRHWVIRIVFSGPSQFRALIG